MKVLVRDECEAELRTAPDDTSRPALEERLETFFAVCVERVQFVIEGERSEGSNKRYMTGSVSAIAADAD